MAKEIYIEPGNYFPDSIQKELGIGKYATDEEESEKKEGDQTYEEKK